MRHLRAVGVWAAAILIAAAVACDETSITSPEPTLVIIEPAEVLISIGEQVRLTATVQNAEGETLGDQPVLWTVDEGGVASISSSGMVQGVEVGTATVTATSAEASGTAVVVVRTGL